MTNDQAIRILNNLTTLGGNDPEVIHIKADEVLLEVVGPTVAEAYRRVVESCPWWATA